MTLRTGYVECDICGKPIILLPTERIAPFTIKGFDRVFHAHSSCKIQLVRSHRAKNWKLLPDGPLKQLYFETLKQQGRPI